MLRYFHYFCGSLHRPNQPLLTFIRFLYTSTSESKEAGAAILILTCFASALMIGYSLALSSDGVLISHKKRRDNINLFSDYVFSTIREKISQANLNRSFVLCGTNLDELLNLGNGNTFKGKPIRLKDCKHDAKSALGDRSLPFNMINADKSMIIIDESIMSEEDKKKLKRVFTVRLKIVGNQSKQKTFTQTVAYEFTVSVLRFSDFGLTLRSVNLSVVSGPRVKIYSPTFITTANPFDPNSVVNGEVEFRDIVVTRAPRLNLSDTRQFQQTFRAGLVTDYYHQSLKTFPGKDNVWELDGDALRKNSGQNTSDTSLWYDNNRITGQPPILTNDPPRKDDEFYYANGKTTLDKALNVQTPSEVHPQAYQKQQHGCPPTGNTNITYHLPYFVLNLQQPHSVQIRLGDPPDPETMWWHKRILCAVFVTKSVTIELPDQGDEDYIFFGLMSVNQLTVSGPSNTTLHIINPLDFRGDLIDFDHATPGTNTLSSYLQQHHLLTYPTLQSMSDQLRSHSPGILSNFFLPITKIGQPPKQYKNWYNQVFNGPVLPFAYDNSTPPNIIESLYELSQESSASFNTYKDLGNLASQPYYTVKMKRIVDDQGDHEVN